MPQGVVSQYSLFWNSTPPTLSVFMQPIFLGGNKLAAVSQLSTSSGSKSTSTFETTLTASTNGVDHRTVPTASRNVQIGVAVGGSLGVALLLCLGFFLLRRYRRKRQVKTAQGDVPANSRDYHDKAELAGYTGRPVYVTKAELDSSAARSELDGTPKNHCGAGIYVQKPELVGTSGVPGLSGVYVKKSELENTQAGTKSRIDAVELMASLPTATATDTCTLSSPESSRALSPRAQTVSPLSISVAPARGQ
ncbi:Uu.00g087450.m01.CDS01 [Anthostomella pinea]|uniref:Uu.00g087450.m01.CDS01 n=1 Tax=Anthostomella pinea TaxID=933095 RepID=A0AAI8YHK9_9PEZI|nr:Uu.00g087450.m01.CDS01 [Anthostomella pinea]